MTLDLKNSQPTITINGEYSGYNNCTITDSWWNEEDGGRTYGIKSHELTQTSFYDYSTNGNRVARHEVHNTHLNSMVAGGACEYMNVTANCSFDPMYLSWSFLQNGSSAGLSVLETGMTINKMESIGGDKALFQTSTSTEDYLVVTGSTLGASGETIINVVSGASAGRTFSWPTNLSTAGGVDPSDRYMQRSDFLCGYWKSGEEHSVVNRKRLYSQYKQTQLWGTSATADKKIVFRDIDYTNELPVGTELFMAIWAHPDGFKSEESRKSQDSRWITFLYKTIVYTKMSNRCSFRAALLLELIT